MPAQTFPLFYQTPAPPKVPVVFALFFFAASICTQTPAQDHTGRFLVLAVAQAKADSNESKLQVCDTLAMSKKEMALLQNVHIKEKEKQHGQ